MQRAEAALADAEAAERAAAAAAAVATAHEEVAGTQAGAAEQVRLPKAGLNPADCCRSPAHPERRSPPV